MSIPDRQEKIKSSMPFEEISLDEVEKHYPSEKNVGIEGSKGHFSAKNKKDLLIVGIIILVGTGSYGIGRLSSIESKREPIRILYSETTTTTPPVSLPKAAPKTVTPNPNPASAVSAVKEIQPGMLVGAKTGTKYHFPWCSGAQRIKAENKVWFASVEDARSAGYTPAANCKGLE